MRRREALLIAAAAMGAAVLTFVLMAARGGPSPTLSAASAAAAKEHPSSAAVLPAPSAVQRWSGDNRAFWLGNQRGVALELLAENKVNTWFGPTQPVLVVRCASRATEAFVYTRTATKIEPNAEGKTVTVSIDGEPTRTERWSDSDDRVELFAPDGAAFVQRLLHGDTLRFGYSPHNAADVVAQFHITGLAKLLEPVAKQCGWKK
jgi:type VI secretion system VasI family protein